MHILGHRLLTRLLTVPHCLIQQDTWLCTGEESGLHSEVVLSVWLLLRLLQKLRARVRGARQGKKKVASVDKAAKYFL